MSHDPHRYLVRDERVILEVRRHFAVLLPSVAAALGVVATATILGLALTPRTSNDALDKLLGYTAAFFLFRLAWQIYQWWIDRIVVTDQRIFEVSGVLSRRVASMPLTRVTDMMYRRSLLGRMLGYGDLIVESAGQDQALGTIDKLPDPDHFYRTITSLVTGRVRRGGRDDGTGGGTPGDAADTGPLPKVVV